MFAGAQSANGHPFKLLTTEGDDMKLASFRREVHAQLEGWVAVLLGTLPLAALHWLALRYADG